MCPLRAMQWQDKKKPHGIKTANWPLSRPVAGRSADRILNNSNGGYDRMDDSTHLKAQEAKPVEEGKRESQARAAAILESEITNAEP